jgi:hypothetical protein
MSHDERQRVIGRVMFHHPDAFLDAVASVSGQLDGRACMVCGAALDVSGATSVPTGYGSRGQLFACIQHGTD